MSARLGVPYDLGAVSPLEIARSILPIANITFFVRGDSGHSCALLPVLRELGQVHVVNSDKDLEPSALSRFGLSGIVTFSDPMLRMTAQIAGTLGLPFHNAATAYRLTDKTAQRLALASSGVERIRNARIETAHDWAAGVQAVGFPFVMKPAWGEGSRDTYLVLDGQDATTAMAAFMRTRTEPDGTERAFVLEELLVGHATPPTADYVSVETISWEGEAYLIGVTGKFPLMYPFREPGQFWPSALLENECNAVWALVRDSVRAIGVREGLCHTEVKLTPTGPRVIEVNGRLGGHIADLVLRSVGVDLVQQAALVALGRQPVLDYRAATSVVFQRHALAPIWPSIFLGVRGASSARLVSGIQGHRTFARERQVLNRGVMTNELDMLWGECSDFDQMRSSISRAGETLSYGFEVDGEAHWLMGIELEARGASKDTKSWVA